MTLTNEAVLVVDVDGRTAEFRLEQLEDESTVSRNYLLGGRGTGFRQAVNIGSDVLSDDVAGDVDLETRKGYFVDGGGGSVETTLSFTATANTSPWGDGSGTGVTEYDASGDESRIAKRQVFDYVVSQATPDSESPASLHIGEWTDGSFSDSAGVYAEPKPVTIRQASINRETDDPSAISGTVTVEWLARFPDLSEVANDIASGLSEFITEF